MRPRSYTGEGRCQSCGTRLAPARLVDTDEHGRTLTGTARMEARRPGDGGVGRGGADKTQLAGGSRGPRVSGDDVNMRDEEPKRRNYGKWDGEPAKNSGKFCSRQCEVLAECGSKQREPVSFEDVALVVRGQAAFHKRRSRLRDRA